MKETIIGRGMAQPKKIIGSVIDGIWAWRMAAAAGGGSGENRKRRRLAAALKPMTKASKTSHRTGSKR